MGLRIKNLFLLSEWGFLNKKNTAILDIGSQNLYDATPELIREFVQRHGRCIENQEEFDKEAARISYFSYPRPGERTSYLSELLDFTNFFYTSYDVCPALKTEIFDLNDEQLPNHYRERFDIVLNFGTSEHIVNQYNCFKLMHEAVMVGGVIFHQLPSIGWIDHGYFTYHPQFFYDLAQKNGFEIVRFYYTHAGESSFSPLICENVRNPVTYEEVPIDKNMEFTNFNINVLLQKQKRQEFCFPLEISTTHAPLNKDIDIKYKKSEN